MLDRLFVRMCCERCPAVEEDPISLEDLKAGVVPDSDDRDISVSVGGVEVVHYHYVCKACWEILSVHVADIATQPQKKSSQRKRRASRSTDEETGPGD